MASGKRQPTLPHAWDEERSDPGSSEWWMSLSMDASGPCRSPSAPAAKYLAKIWRCDPMRPCRTQWDPNEAETGNRARK
jgi:hypothetical protein